jgi:hypothetical protein
MKIETNASEHCDDAPHEVEFDLTPLLPRIREVTKTLQALDLSYAVEWYAGPNCEYFNEDGDVVEIAHYYQQHFKIYKDGDIQLVWESKWDSNWEFWVDVSARDMPASEEPITTKVGDWAIEDNGEYVYLRYKDKPGDIQVKAEDEGYVVDIYSDDQTTEATTYCF